MIRLIAVLVLISSLIFISGCVTSNIQEGICEINKEYPHTAVNPVNCSCPEGYSFEVQSRGWGTCPNENMTDCPMSVLKCVES